MEIEFVNDQIGYAAGGDSGSYKPLIQKTVDGGMTWTLSSDQFSPAKNEITGISFINEQMGWAITYDGYVFQTLDGGNHWSCIDSIRTTLVTGNPPMRDIEFVSADSGWAVGGIAGGMTIARTVTGGKGWIIDVHGGSSLREIHFVTSKIGWICGESNARPFIAKTVDGGLSWEDQTPQINGIVGVQSISIVNQTHGFAAAHKSINRIPIVLTMSNPVSVDLNRDHITRPDWTVLLNNYPNPFNPDTRINYILNTPSEVSLKIYNVNGEEIITLVSGHQQPGAKTVHWDGRDNQGRMMPSGIYICRLQAGDFVIARKMSLVK